MKIQHAKNFATVLILSAASSSSAVAQEMRCTPNPNYSAEFERYQAKVEEYEKDSAAYSEAFRTYQEADRIYKEKVKMRYLQIDQRARDLTSTLSEKEPALQEALKQEPKFPSLLVSAQKRKQYVRARIDKASQEIKDIRANSKRFEAKFEICQSGVFERSYFTEAQYLTSLLQELAEFPATKELVSKKLLAQADEFLKIQLRKGKFCSSKPESYGAARLDGNFGFIEGATQVQDMIARGIIGDLEKIVSTLEKSAKENKENVRRQLDEVARVAREQADKEIAQIAHPVAPSKPKAPISPVKEHCVEVFEDIQQEEIPAEETTTPDSNSEAVE